MTAVNKQKRQFKIKEIISAQNIASQEELVYELRMQNFDATQATLSRDLNEMGIVRIPTENGFKYSFAKHELNKSLLPVVAMEILSLTANENVIVVKTLTGRAQGVAVFFDELEDSHIIGTIAGDDTIIIIPDSVKHLSDIMSMLNRLMSGKSE
jgi:transcriptional regulator of arginine metabolism